MTVSDAEHRLLHRISQVYYSDGLTQEQIARRFGLSRPKVSRLLQKARDAGIVTITLLPPPSGLADVECAIEQKFGLHEAVVVPVTDPNNLAAVARELGPAGAECLLRSISDGQIVGMTWGTTVLAVVEALQARPCPRLTVVQLLGGLGPADAQEHSIALTLRAAQKLNARPRLLPAPGIVSTAETARVLRSDPQIAETLALGARADVAVVGIGVQHPDSVLWTGTILRGEDVEPLRRAGAVGDIGLRFFDANGRPLKMEINERMIGLPLDQIEKIPRVIGVAGGSAKYEVIRAALRGRLVDVLVTDHGTARRLLADTEAGRG